MKSTCANNQSILNQNYLKSDDMICVGKRCIKIKFFTQDFPKTQKEFNMSNEFIAAQIYFKENYDLLKTKYSKENWLVHIGPTEHIQNCTTMYIEKCNGNCILKNTHQDM